MRDLSEVKRTRRPRSPADPVNPRTVSRPTVVNRRTRSPHFRCPGRCDVLRNSPVVLIVDDHQDSVAMYAFGLLAMGFQPVTAGTAAEAFGRACTCYPDVVVADVTLSGGSGLDLTRQLRQD